jgi:hypothetical protein
MVLSVTVGTVVAVCCRALLTSRTLTTLDVVLPIVPLGGAANFTADGFGTFSVTARSGMTVFMILVLGDLVVDRILISWKFGNSKLFPRLLLWGCMVDFGFWPTIKATSVEKSWFSLVSTEVTAADDDMLLFGLRLNLVAPD